MPVNQMDLSVSRLSKFGIVRHRNYRAFLIMGKIMQYVADIAAGFGIQRAGGLIGQNQHRIIGKRPGYRHTLSLSSGKLAGKLMFMFLHIQIIQQHTCFLPCL
eukprot:RCo035436